MVDNELVLNLVPGDPPPVVHVAQYDVGRTISATITNGGAKFVHDSSYTYVVSGTKPSGTGFYDEARLVSNKVCFDTTAVMTVVAGAVRCGLTIMNDDVRIGTAEFIMLVHKAAVDEETIIDSDDFGGLVNERVDELLDERFAPDGDVDLMIKDAIDEALDPEGLIVADDEHVSELVENWMDDQIQNSAEFKQEMQELVDMRPLNVLTLGVDNTGKTDCSEILNNYRGLRPLFFPAGLYLLNRTFFPKVSISGEGFNRRNGIYITTFDTDIPNEQSTVFIQGPSMPSPVIFVGTKYPPGGDRSDPYYDDTYEEGFTPYYDNTGNIVYDYPVETYVRNIEIFMSEDPHNKCTGNGIAMEIELYSSYYGVTVDCVNVAGLYNGEAFYAHGYIRPTNISPANQGGLYMHNIGVMGRGFGYDSIGLHLGKQLMDCQFSMLQIEGVRRGIVVDEHAFHNFNNVHVWTGSYSQAPLSPTTWYHTPEDIAYAQEYAKTIETVENACKTRTIVCYGDNSAINISNLYADTAFCVLETGPNSNIHITNLNYWDGGAGGIVRPLLEEYTKDYSTTPGETNPYIVDGEYMYGSPGLVYMRDRATDFSIETDENTGHKIWVASEGALQSFSTGCVGITNANIEVSKCYRELCNVDGALRLDGVYRFFYNWEDTESGTTFDNIVNLFSLPPQALSFVQNSRRSVRTSWPALYFHTVTSWWGWDWYTTDPSETREKEGVTEQAEAVTYYVPIAVINPPREFPNTPRSATDSSELATNLKIRVSSEWRNIDEITMSVYTKPTTAACDIYQTQTYVTNVTSSRIRSGYVSNDWSYSDTRYLNGQLYYRVIGTFIVIYVRCDPTYSGPKPETYNVEILDAAATMTILNPFTEIAARNGYTSFAEYFVTLKESELIKIEPTVNDSTAGAQVLIFGDSITDSCDFSINYTTNKTNSVSWRNTPAYASSATYSVWPKLLKDTNEFSEIRNYALAGASYKTWASRTGDNVRKNLQYQITLAINDVDNYNAFSSSISPDIVIFALGTNDWTNDWPSDTNDTYTSAMNKTVYESDGYSIDVSATINNLDDTKFCESARKAFLRIKQAFPSAQIYCILPLQRSENDNWSTSRQYLYEMAQRYGCIIVDGTGESGIVREFNTYNGDGTYLCDGLHPNALGQSLLTRLIYTSIKTHFTSVKHNFN